VRQITLDAEEDAILREEASARGLSYGRVVGLALRALRESGEKA
jgi:hypothetical protein